MSWLRRRTTADRQSASGSPTAEESLPIAELLAEVRQIELHSRELVTEGLAGGYSSVFKGQGIEFDTVREYAPGDDPRSIDWNVTARTGKPHIKKFVDERELCSMFVFDLSASMSGGFAAWSMRQMAARICACLAVSAVRSQDRVGWLGCSAAVDRYVPPGRGMPHAMRIVRECLAARASGPGIDWTLALDSAARLLRRRSVMFLVSDFLPSRGSTGNSGSLAADEAFEHALLPCARRHDVVAISIEPPELLHDPPPGVFALGRDPETLETTCWMDGHDPDARAAQRLAIAEHQAAMEDLWERAGVDRIRVPLPRIADPDAVAQPIIDFFERRARRRSSP